MKLYTEDFFFKAAVLKPCCGSLNLMKILKGVSQQLVKPDRHCPASACPTQACKVLSQLCGLAPH